MDYEGALISKVLTENTLTEVFDNRVQDELFLVHPNVWQHLMEVYAKHGGLPPVEDVAKKFPEFEIQQAADYPVTYLIEEMRKRHVHNLVTDAMRKQAELLKAKDPFGALEEMRNVMIQADVDIRPSCDINFASDVDERVKLYDEAAVSGGLTGIPSPWPCLDEVTQGFQSEDFIMIAGRGGIGKCIDAESRIVDPLIGIERTIREVVEGGQESIFSWDADQGVCEEMISNKIDTGRKVCFSYALDSGREIIVTPEHPFLTPKGWLRADLLGVGDFVALPANLPFPKLPLEDLSFSDIRFLALGDSYGERAVDKTIPDSVYRLGPELLGQFLSFLWMSEGYVDATGPVITSSRRRSEQLQHLLLRFGIQSSIGYASGKGDSEVWCLRVCSHCAKSFSEVITLCGEKKTALEVFLYDQSFTQTNSDVDELGGLDYEGSDWNKPGVRWDRISDIQCVGERKIYDLTINTTHCFIANDVIVHNTWSELVCAWKNWSDGYVPLVFSREMAVWQMSRRLDAINAKLPYKRFKAGLLTSDELARWKQSLELLKGARPMWITGDDGDGNLGVTAITNKIRQYRPHVVYIDGAYLIKDDLKGKEKWERFYNVCQSLKRLAQREKLPVIVTHQFSASGKGMDGTEDTLKFGDVQMWFDLIIGCYRSEDMVANKEMLFKILKSREGEQLDWVSEWDLDTMSFDVKPGEDDLRESEKPYEEEDPVKF